MQAGAVLHTDRGVITCGDRGGITRTARVRLLVSLSTHIEDSVKMYYNARTNFRDA